MEEAEKLFQRLQLHPVADHFTIALLTIALLIDLAASIFPARVWLRNSALTLMILGALAAVASYSTGDIEADRAWKMMSQAAKSYFKGASSFLGHGSLGYYLMFVFVALALWRILLALFNFMARTRPLYLLIAVIAIGFLFYQGHTGGELVYEYEVGTGWMEAGASPTPAPTPTSPPTPIPSVYVPPPTPPITAPTAVLAVPTAGASAEIAPTAAPALSTPSAK